MGLSSQGGRARHAATACLLLSCLGAAAAITPIYDETLWTKTLWATKWKLDKALVGNPTDEAPALLSSYPGIRDAPHNSLDGPYPKRQGVVSEGQDRTDPEALDDMSLLTPAAHAVKCSVCNALVALTWHRMVVDLLRGSIDTFTAPALVPQYMAAACHTEIADILQRKVVYRLDLENEAQALTFFVLRPRKPGTLATQAERAAVQLACTEIVSVMSSEAAHQFTAQLRGFRRGLNSLLAQHNLAPLPTEAPEAGSGGGGDAQEQAGSGGQSGEGGATATATATAAGNQAEHGSGEAGARDGSSSAAQDAHTQKVLRGLAVHLKRAAVQELANIATAGTGGSAATKFKSASVDLNSNEEGDEYLDPDDDEDTEDEDGEGSTCVDLHPMCEQWANEGECDANPNYMVGNAHLKGHCRRACGECTPTALTPAELVSSHPALVKGVQQLSASMLKTATSHVCSLTQSCLNVAGEVAVAGGVVSTKPGHDAAPKHQSAGFVLGRPSFGAPVLVHSPAAEAAYAHVRAAEAAHARDAPPGAISELQLQVDSVLGAELGGRLLHFHDTFFTYEYVYKNHTRHFHDEPRGSGVVTEDWLLGTFQRERVVVEALTGGPASLETLDLIPDLTGPPGAPPTPSPGSTPQDATSAASHAPGQHGNAVLAPGQDMSALAWPYVKQVYANGELCVLGGGRQVVRRTEVRIACSPDGRLRFLVREPDFCHYLFVLYSPALCTVPHYRPVPKAPAGGAAAQ